MTRTSLTQLEARDAFIARHIGPSATEQQAMLATLGYPSRAALIDALVPANIRNKGALPLGAYSQPMPEQEALSRLKAIAGKNQVLKSLIGQGYYNTFTPGVVLRNIFENPAWYTAYTPYQPEISQGRLEAILNFQQVITDLTGMGISNASMLDEGTAAAEAMTLIQRVGKSKSNVLYVANDVLPQTLEVVQTRAQPIGIEVRTFDPAEIESLDACFGVLLQYPGVNGVVRDYRAGVEKLHATGAMVIVAADLLALTMLTPPGEWGADVVVGNSQRFGVPLGFGGPHAGYLSTRDEFKRNMSGRLVGVTVDAQGNKAYRLALQTREQHIRREKATSNICTAQVLLAVMASMYAVYHGPAGLLQIAQRVHRFTGVLAANLKTLGYGVVNASYFDTLTINVADAAQLHATAMHHGVNLRKIDNTHVGVSLDETTTRDDIALLWKVFAHGLANAPAAPDLDAVEAAVTSALPANLARESAYLTHPVFNSYHSEHEMLRYLRSLADKDLALDRTMIPLGSCTMKLNATSEMIPSHLARVLQYPPVRARCANGRLPRNDRAAGRNAVRIDRLRRRLAAAKRRLAGRIRGSAGDQGVSRVARRRPPQHLSDSIVGARHQPRIGQHGRHAGGRHQLRRQRQRGPGRPEGESGKAQRQPGLRDGHLPVHPRRV